MKVIILTKHAVQLPKKKRTKYVFQKVKMCKKCQRYTVLKDENCPECGTIYSGVESLARSIFKNRLFSEAITILTVVCLGIIFAPTVRMLYYSLIAGVLFTLGYVSLTLIFIKSEYRIQLQKLLKEDIEKIKAGIQLDSIRAKEDVRADNVAASYDKLREICDFIDTDQLKIRSVMALNEIALRKDMELELETLIPSAYDKGFLKYALEVVKINRSLITKKSIAYFVEHRTEIVRDYGIDSLITVAGSALRMKLYILEFSDFIQEFIDYFPKDRILRLCNILHANPEENWGSLAEKTKHLVRLKYNYDPDFKHFV
ncbi:hypothetical protein [Bacillus sp. OK048]|uniref:hypothetical protein n=1 Tax=Bacillus sp. OK048 TaxID=1882761 RepID=UPI001C31BA3B|nr:hypothetical protein [Bacillus sp. OK048]